MTYKIMQSTLQEDCIRSAGLYLKYLNENRNKGKGMFSAQVRSVQKNMLNTELALNLDRKIRSAEGIMIRIGGTIYENADATVHFFVQSVERRTVVISPTPELAERIDEALATKEKMFVEVDLTFLVKRVKNWYEKYGESVELPTVRPTCQLDPRNPIALSDNQP